MNQIGSFPQTFGMKMQNISNHHLDYSTPPKTNKCPLKINGWKMPFPVEIVPSISMSSLGWLKKNGIWTLYYVTWHPLGHKEKPGKLRDPKIHHQTLGVQVDHEINSLELPPTRDSSHHQDYEQFFLEKTIILYSDLTWQPLGKTRD